MQWKQANFTLWDTHYNVNQPPDVGWLNTWKCHVSLPSSFQYITVDFGPKLTL